MPASARTAPVLGPMLWLGLCLAAAPAAAQGEAQGGVQSGVAPRHPATHQAHRPAPHAAHATAGRHPAHAHARPAMHAPQRLVHHAPAPAIVAPVPVPVPAATPPAGPAAAPKGASTGLPLPRYASLRADAVNLRGGPGTRYPIQWVYRRRDLPVRIEREFDVWRLVEDSDGVKGWVHQATLVGTRSFVIPTHADGSAAQSAGGSAPGPAEGAEGTEAGEAPPVAGADGKPGAGGARVVGRFDPLSVGLPPGAQALRSAPQSDAPLVAVLKPGIVGRIRACPAGSGWCRVSVRDYSGWLPRDAFWGVLPDETIQP